MQKVLKTPGGWDEGKVNRRFRKLAKASSRLEGRVRNRASNVAGLSGNLLGLGVASAVNAGIKKHNKKSNRENEKDKAFSSKDERIDNAAIGSLAGASGLATADVIMSRKAKKDLEKYQKAVKKIEEYRKASTNAAKKVASKYNIKPADLQKSINETNYQHDSYRKLLGPERTALKKKLKDIKTLRKFHKYSIPVAVGLSGAAVYKDRKNKTSK